MPTRTPQPRRKAFKHPEVAELHDLLQESIRPILQNPLLASGDFRFTQVAGVRGAAPTWALQYRTPGTQTWTTIVSFDSLGNSPYIPKSLLTAAGDIIYASAASTPARLGIGSAGQSLGISAGLPAWLAPSGSGGTLTNAFIVSPHRKGGFYRPVATGGGQEKFGIQAPTAIVGTTNAESADKLMVAFGSTGTGIGATGGYAGPFTETEPRYKPYMSVSGIPRWNTIYKHRAWVGLASASLTGLAVLNNTSAASALKFAAIGWDVNVSSNIMLCSGDGVNYSCQDTGVAMPADFHCNFILDWSTAGSLSASMQVMGSAVVSLGTKTTNLLGGTDATKLGVTWTYTVQRNLDDPVLFLSSLYLEQN